MSALIKQIDTLIEDFDINEAFKLSIEGVNSNNVDIETQELLTLRCIKCLIFITKLENTHDYIDENNNMVPTEIGKEDLDLIGKYIFKLIKFLDKDDQEKINHMYQEVHDYVNAHYLHFLPLYVGKITSEDSIPAHTKYVNGFLCMSQHVLLKFIDLSKMACIRNVPFDPCYFKKTYVEAAGLLHAQYEVVLDSINELTEDFPYFVKDDGVEVSHRYNTANYLLQVAIIRLSNSDDCVTEVLNVWKKERINIVTDMLNVILVHNGQRQSLFYGKSAREEFLNAILQLEKEIQQTEPDYTRPPCSEGGVSTMNGGCYVATAVYGSYDCAPVWTLRRFRDSTLSSTWYGRLFIRTYYKISPTLVKLFGNTAWFRNLWKPQLDRLVNKLQSQGVASTPYEDRPWDSR